MDCPRRLKDFGPYDRTEDGRDCWKDDQTCSFCGGLKPSQVFELLEQGNHIIPTDKVYKIYIGTSP